MLFKWTLKNLQQFYWYKVLMKYEFLKSYMDKILVTGYNGFIGHNLVDRLITKYKIIGVSNNKTAKQKIFQVKKDVRKINSDDIPNDVFCIVHLAAITDLKYCQNNPSECFDVNVKGTQNMLEIARKKNSKFIYLSTSHVYGRPLHLPMREDHPRNPNSIYASSKMAGEVICESYAKSYGLDLSILRLFSVYGPNSPSHLVTSKIINQLLNKKIVSLGNLYPKRDFVYVQDVMDAILLVIRRSMGFNIYNVGTGKSHSILELCKILREISGRNTQIQSIKSQSRKNEIGNVISNSSRIKRLGWRPKTSIHQGLEITFEWFLNPGKPLYF